MPGSIVSDSSPIISFARAGRLELIRSVCREIVIPPKVYDEVVVKGKDKPGAEEIRNAPWVRIQEPGNKDEVEKLREKFGPGEAEAIALAQELKASLLADEWSVIKEARSKGIKITSTHLLLIEAKRKGFIKSVRKELDGLIASGFRTTPELIYESLRKAGEE